MSVDPTFVVGVGQAGIKVANALAEVTEENDEREYFEFVTLDSDSEMLGQDPSGSLRLKVEHDAGFVEEDAHKYPYLTRSMAEHLGAQGAMRRRPVGRYMLDSRGKKSFSDIYDALWDSAKKQYDEATARTSATDDTFRIYLIHSLGGGTGSGTFPLLAAMLKELGSALEQTEANTEVYMPGVGVVPQLVFDPTIRDGPERYLENVYAAMRDLATLESLSDPEESRTLPVYAQTLGGSMTAHDSKFELDSPPFHDYWLFDIDESRMLDLVDQSGIESYTERVNQTIAGSLHAISKGKNVENWTDEKPCVGSFDESEIRVPHDEVLDYYELRIERQKKIQRVNEEIPEKIADLESRKTELRELRQRFTEGPVPDSDFEEAVTDRIHRAISNSSELVLSKTAEDIEQLLDEIEHEYDEAGVIVATSILSEILYDDNGIQSVKSDWNEVVTELWSAYNMSTRSEFSGQSATTIEAKAAMLRDFFTDHIDRYEQLIDNWNPSLVGRVQDMLPPHGPFESDREEAKRVLEKLRHSLDDLGRAERSWLQANEIREVVEDRHQSGRTWIDRQLNQTEKRLSELQTERDRLQQNINTVADDIESIVASLATEQANHRTTVLPINTDVLEDIDPENADDVLTSLSAYVEEGLINQEDIELASSHCLELADATANRSVIDADLSSEELPQPVFEPATDTFLLYHEDNDRYESNISVNSRGETWISGKRLDYLSDPYRIEFVSFYRRGPVPALTFYQQLAELAEDGTLDVSASQYSGDHRLAFAYPEWYSEDIRRAFDIS